MKPQFLFLCLMIALTLLACENHVSLTPKASRFIASKHLYRLDGTEGISHKLRDYIRREQSNKRKIASASNLNPAFAPENNPKFRLSYFLIPTDSAQFLSAKTKDVRVLDELNLRISGKLHTKFFIHPEREMELNALRGRYDYVGPDSTEFLATPTTDYYTLVVWNRNNLNRKPFILKLNVEKSDQENKFDKQIVDDLPIADTVENNK